MTRSTSWLRSDLDELEDEVVSRRSSLLVMDLRDLALGGSLPWLPTLSRCLPLPTDC